MQFNVPKKLMQIEPGKKGRFCMTRLTAEFKSDRRYKRRRLCLKKPKCSQYDPYHTYTNFSGNYGQSYIAKDLADDLKYAQAVCRQKFW